MAHAPEDGTFAGPAELLEYFDAADQTDLAIAFDAFGEDSFLVMEIDDETVMTSPNWPRSRTTLGRPRMTQSFVRGCKRFDD